jgi:peptide/nickel transport system ATP-binding protein
MDKITKILEIKNLSVVYHTAEADVYAVNGIDLSLNSGEVLGLVGETGAGKTTTALSTMALLPEKIGEITSGEIIVDGVDIIKAKEQDKRLMRGSTMSMIFQDPMSSLNPVISVGDQIYEVLNEHNTTGKSKQELDRDVDQIMEMVGIPAERKKEFPHQFSGGMKQRIVIAIALACRPKLILADEPTTALDVTIQAQVLTMMLDLKKELNTAMIMITHDLGIVAQTCQKVAVMYAGVIVEEGRVEEIFDQDILHPYTRGLFEAIPRIDIETDRLVPIDGAVSDPTVKAEGCPFADRCRKCMQKCRKNYPPMYNLGGEHRIRCFLFENENREGKHNG